MSENCVKYPFNNLDSISEIYQKNFLEAFDNYTPKKLKVVVTKTLLSAKGLGNLP